MQVLVFTPLPELLASLALLMPPYEPFVAQPPPTIDIPAMLQRLGRTPHEVGRAYREAQRRYGTKQQRAGAPRRRDVAARRNVEIRPTTKLLPSDVTEMRAGWARTRGLRTRAARGAYIRAVVAHLAQQGVDVSERTVDEALSGKSWAAEPTYEAARSSMAERRAEFRAYLEEWRTMGQIQTRFDCTREAVKIRLGKLRRQEGCVIARRATTDEVRRVAGWRWEYRVMAEPTA